jgi:hypothetical protein
MNYEYRVMRAQEEKLKSLSSEEESILSLLVDAKTKAMDYADRMDRKLSDRIEQLENRLVRIEITINRKRFFKKIKNHLAGVKDAK